MINENQLFDKYDSVIGILHNGYFCYLISVHATTLLHFALSDILAVGLFTWDRDRTTLYVVYYTFTLKVQMGGNITSSAAAAAICWASAPVAPADRKYNPVFLT